ncbi:MAG: ATP-binding protein [Bacteroidales bacterium]
MRTNTTVLSRKLRRAPYAAAGIAIAIGAGHLAAWLIGAMIRVSSSTIIMKANAALGVVVCGVGLILGAAEAPAPVRRRFAAACGAFAVLLGVATLAEHIFGWNLGIDQLIATEPAGRAATSSPNRMGLPASVSFILLGSAILLVCRGVRGRLSHEWLALLVGLLNLLAITGYLYQASELYDITRVTAIAWPTAASFLMLALGLLCTRPSEGLMALVTADDAGGVIARALLGPMLLLPLVFGWARLAGERLGWFDASMGTALTMVIFVVTFTSLLLFASGRVSLASAAQRTSEEALRQGQQFLSFALTTARTGAWDLDLVDHTARRSPEHDRIFGYDRLLPQWTYEMFLEHVVAEDREAVDRAFRHAMETGSDWNFECRVVQPGGHNRWIWAAGRRRTDGDGHPRMAGVVQDITERRLAEESLRKSERQFRVLIENVNAGVALIDESGRFSLYNRQFLRLFGLSADADIKNVNDVDWSAWQVFDEHGRLLDVDEHPVRKAARSGQAVRDTLVEVRPPGGATATWMLISAEPLLGEDGRPERVICTYSDITERKRAELALREANQRLQEADQRKDEFLAVLSHELRNPLAPVRAALYVLERAEPGGEQASRAVSIMDRQIGQLTHLVDDLLDVTRVARGKIQLQLEIVDVADLVRRTAEDHRALFSRKQIALDVVVGDVELWVDGDTHRLAQVVGNLLHNAAKFTERGGHAEIRAGRDEEGRAAVISVRDDGVGIGPASLPRLFEPFMQVDTTLDRSRGGLGLGLALVKSLVDMHGGTVTAASAGTGCGSEFTVRLPLRAGVAADASVRTRSSHRARRIVIIEDNVDAAETLREALELAGHQVEVAYDGIEGIETARRFNPDVVLCDIGLPAMNGYEVARALRADEATGSVYLVALTGYALPDDLAKAQAAGFDVHAAKPLSPDALHEILAAADGNDHRP